MRAIKAWSDKIQDTEGNPQPIYDIIYTQDGSNLIVGAGAEILVYSASDGDMIKSLKGHKDTVLCLTPLQGGGFASGSADKHVIIWNSKLEGILKYSHGESVQCLSQNPVTNVVLSCTSSDFGIWSSEVKSVNKTKVSSRILCCAWTSDGQHFALGFYNGHVSIRSRTGEETVRIERGNLPVWSLSWSPSSDLNDSDVLAVTDWSQRLSFFQLSGRQVGKDRLLDYDPCTVSYMLSGEYVLMGGSDRKVHLWTADGIRIAPVCEEEGWIWAARAQPKQNTVAVASNDGTVSVYQLQFQTVHGLYADRYAFRQNMTDVVIQHLITNQRARIKCRDYVKKIAVYKDRLAVQLPERIIIYELFHDDSGDMHYRIKEKLNKRMDCHLLVITSQHLILCLDQRLQLFNFLGEKEREWSFEAPIRYIKVIGGPKGREGIAVGLKSGAIFEIFIDNPFSIPLIQHTSPVRCVDLNLTKTKVALVDDDNTCFVYRIATKELLYQEPNAHSVAWNTEMDDMLCYAGNGALNVKVSTFPPHQQKINGFVVGFKASRVFILSTQTMTTIDIPQTIPMERYMERNDFEAAYRIACLGVPESDWRKLGMEALERLQFEVAKKAFLRIRDMKMVDVVRHVEKLKVELSRESDYILGEVYALSDKFHEAARLFKKSGHVQRAIEMFTELNLWEYATQFAEDSNGQTQEILKRKAQMQQDRKDILAAAATYEQVGDYMQAVELLGPGGHVDRMIEIVRRVQPTEIDLLNKCVFFFKKANQYAYATEALKKAGNIPTLLKLLTDLQQWDEAFKIAEIYPDHQSILFLPYGQWLALNDRFEEAQEFYMRAGRPDEAIRVLKRLTDCAIVQSRFADAAAYYITLSKEYLGMVPVNLSTAELDANQQKCHDMYYKYQRLARIYFAYSHVFRYVEDPFIMTVPEVLLDMARYLYMHLQTVSGSHYPGISKVFVVYTIANISKTMGGNKLAKQAYEKLLTMHLSPDWTNMIELAAMKSRSKPLTDSHELFIHCYRCNEANAPLSLINGSTNETKRDKYSDSCQQCQEPRVRSIYSFAVLPLVEFVPEKSISAKEMEDILAGQAPSIRDSVRQSQQQRDSSSRGGLAGSRASLASAFRKTEPEVLSRQQLLEIDVNQVFIRRSKAVCVPTQYYRLMNPNVHVTMCPSCQEFLLEDEWLYQILSEGKCPFCRVSAVVDGTV